MRWMAWKWKWMNEKFLWRNKYKEWWWWWYFHLQHFFFVFFNGFGSFDNNKCKNRESRERDKTLYKQVWCFSYFLYVHPQWIKMNDILDHHHHHHHHELFWHFISFHFSSSSYFKIYKCLIVNGGLVI